jgi:AhpD family alkylhydroperoxidase
MNQRISFDVVPQAYAAQKALEEYIATTALPPDLVQLVKLRVSTMNGCAFCIDMHWTALRKAGQSEQRLYGLTTWRELAGYSAQERAALAWAEAVTEVASSRVPDAVYDQARACFTEKDLADLTFVVVAINGWNRLCVAFRIPPASALPKPAASTAGS